MDDLAYKEKICAQCGKKFIKQTEDWAYKKYSSGLQKVFCSYSCMRMWESEHKNPKQRRDKICQALADGLSVNEIVNLLGEDRRMVQYWKKRLEKE